MLILVQQIPESLHCTTLTLCSLFIEKKHREPVPLGLRLPHLVHGTGACAWLVRMRACVWREPAGAVEPNAGVVTLHPDQLGVAPFKSRMIENGGCRDKDKKILYSNRF